jgi:hypothetical protein
MILSIFNKKEIHTAQVYTLEELSEINSPRINFTYLKRLVDQDISLFANLLIKHHFTGINEVVTKATVKSIISEKFDEAQLHFTGKSLFAEDITKLTCLFMDIIKEDVIQLYLKVVSNDACSKFHTDLYDLRLLCTYEGKGTEWVEEQNVNRKMLMKGEKHQIIKDQSKVNAMEPFEVGILKGEASAKNKGRGIVHRSPPILQTGEKRLLLRLDY